MRIEDEYGATWRVEPGDVATEPVGILRRKGFTYIVLPRAILCGILNFLPCEPASWRPPSPADLSPERLVRAYRLYDCMVVLKEENGRNSHQQKDRFRSLAQTVEQTKAVGDSQ